MKQSIKQSGGLLKMITRLFIWAIWRMFHFLLIVSVYLPGAKIRLICLWLESRDDSPCTSHLGVILALSNPTPHSLPIKLSSLNFPYSISSENPYLMRTAPQNQTMKFPPYLTDYGHKYSSTLHPPYIKKKSDNISLISIVFLTQPYQSNAIPLSGCWEFIHNT